MATLARQKRLQPVVEAAEPHSIHMFSTELGWMGLAWRDSEVTRLTFGHATLRAAAHEVAIYLPAVQDNEFPSWIGRLVKRLENFAAGKHDSFLDVPLELSHLTGFQSKVIAACRAIRAGRTRSYADLAAQAGSPRAARAVGNVMRSNRYPLIIPCHRVIGSNGRLCGFTSPQGISMKERLLERERSAAEA